MSAPERVEPAVVAPPAFWRQLLRAQRREVRRLHIELLQMKGLMPLLMKHRNGETWSPEERAELVQHLRSLSRLSPYLMLLLLPGSAFFLPAYAWWLDRRRQKRGPDVEAAQDQFQTD